MEPSATGIARACVGLLLAAQAGLLVWSSSQHSPSLDEVGHMAAGLSRWYFGRFDIYCVNPPLTSTVATLPVFLSNPRTDWEGWGLDIRPEWHIGMRFIEANGPKAFWYFTLARWGCVPLILLGGYFCYRWSTELWGRASGFTALLLWTFSPTVLGNGAMITADTAAASMGVVAHYAFWHWLKGPSWRTAFFAGLALGLAELTKSTWIILFGLWPALWFAWKLLMRRAGSPKVGNQIGQLLFILLFGLYVLNAGYGFTGTLQRLDRYSFHSNALSGRTSATQFTGNRFTGTSLGAVPVPLPSDYVCGIDLQKADFERKMWSYLRGEYRLGGWWYYYLYALAIKEPLGTLALALLATGLAWRSGDYRATWGDELTLILPGVAVFTLVSSQTGFNRYYRYVLPALPYLYIAVSRVGRTWTLRRWPQSCLAGLALTWSVASSLAVFPHSMSYFNELVGGPRGGHYHLIDANIDWGQDVFYLRRWAEKHPEARPLYVYTTGPLAPKQAGIPGVEPPQDRPPGWYAIGIHELHDLNSAYQDFLKRRPDTMVGYTIYIYHLTGEDVRSKSTSALGDDHKEP